MNNKVKRIVALLSAGALLTSSAAAYAAQIPTEPASEAALSSSSSQIEVDTKIHLSSYQLTSDRFRAGIGVSPIEGQIRLTEYFVTISQQKNASSPYETLFSGQLYGDPYNLMIDQEISLDKGGSIELSVTTRSYVFDGYDLAGTAYASETYNFTLE